MDNLDILVKTLNKVENFTVKYIYKKYVELDTILEEDIQENIPSINSSTIMVSQEPILDDKFKYSRKPVNKEEFKLYKDRIFSKKRKSIITQDESLTKDLENMTIADEEYEKTPNAFNRQKYNSYPDEKRCTYIRKIKNKLIRCKNGIINDDEDVCSKHEDTPNIYWDMYNELFE